MARRVDHVELRGGLDRDTAVGLLPDPGEPKRKLIRWTKDEWYAMAAEIWRLRFQYPCRQIGFLIAEAQDHVIEKDRHRELNQHETIKRLKNLVTRCAQEAEQWFKQRKAIESELERTRRHRCLRTHLTEAPEIELEGCIRIILDRIPIHHLIEGLTEEEILSVTSLDKLMVVTTKRFFRDYELSKRQMNDRLDLLSQRLVSHGNGQHQNGSSNGHLKAPANGQAIVASSKTFLVVLYGFPEMYDAAIKAKIKKQVADHVQLLKVEKGDLNPDSIPPLASLIAVWKQYCPKRQLSVVTRRAEKIGMPKNNLLLGTGSLDKFLDTILGACPRRLGNGKPK